MNAPFRSPPDAPRVRAVPASVRIQVALRDAIVGMSLPPGAALAEKDIAEAYGVSRTPVREAILRLAEERLVDVVPQYGTFVARIRLDELPDALVIRTALERITVRAAAERADVHAREQVAAMLARQAGCDRDGDPAAFYATDEQFHQLIAVVAGHPNLWRVVKQEKVQLDRCRVLTLPRPLRRKQILDQHAAIAEAVAAADPDAAEAAMQVHLADVMPSIETLIEAYPDYFHGTGAVARRHRRTVPSHDRDNL